MNIDDLKSLVSSWSAGHRRIVYLVLGGVLLVFVGFVSGRYTSHPQVVEKVKTQIQYRDRVVVQDRVVQKAAGAQETIRHRHRHVKTTRYPNGTVVTETDTNIDTQSGSHAKTDMSSAHTATQVKYVTQTVTQEKLVLQQPNWRVTAGVGVSVPYYIGEGPVGIPGMNGYVVQAGIDRRIVGPFWLGLWGNTQGTVGLDLSAVW